MVIETPVAGRIGISALDAVAEKARGRQGLLDCLCAVDETALDADG